MTGPDPLSAEAVGALTADLDVPAGSPPPPRPAARVALGRVGRRAAAVGRTVARRRIGPLYQRAIRTLDARLSLMVRDAVSGDPAITQVRELSSRGAFDLSSEPERAEAARTDRVNLELLKGEVRHLQSRLEELGMAFAPATGIDGAGARFAELREAVHALERRLRNAAVVQPTPEVSAVAMVDDAPPRTATTRPAELSSTLFDYVGFERRFRGDPEEILQTLVERYEDELSDHQPVVDVGCGRAELLGRLAGQGVEVIGVEPDPGMASEARARGVRVHQELAGDFLRSVPDHSLGSIITTHVLEHLELDDLIELLELSVLKLRPGGVFISETPNPSSLIVLGNSYLLDPTHVRPLHPSLLSFLCENAGFRDVRLRFFSPASGYHLPRVEAPEGAADVAAVAHGVNAGFERLNDVLFGPQDYCVVATTAPDHA